jgi:uncharacterized protein (TIGR00297 family)
MTFEGRVLEYLVLSLFIAPLSLRFAGMDKKGSLAAFFVGFFVYVPLGFSGFIVLFSLHVIGAAVTRTGYSRKQSSGIAQKKRSFANVCANGLLPALAAVLSAVFTDYSSLFYFGYVSTVAAATADTVSSELGELSREKPKLITTFEEVDVGTDGAVSGLGTIAGFAGAAAIAIIAIFVDSRGMPIVLFAIATAAGFVGTTIDSLLGATLERSGKIGNDMVNVLSIAASLVFSTILYLALV